VALAQAPDGTRLYSSNTRTNLVMLMTPTGYA
jgi:hypothetical protein